MPKKDLNSQLGFLQKNVITGNVNQDNLEFYAQNFRVA